ncbi:MAG: phosphatase PAP2 family protein [Cryomorphaceae bacterium]|nr:phosphatase PAP2 family protein [Flavobacteriales bacterium]
MISFLEDIDQKLFLFLNGLHQPWLDQPMYVMTDKLTWIPIYLLLIFMIKRAYNWRVVLWILLGVAVVVTLCDRISVELFKNVFERYRPSRNHDLAEMVHIVNGYRGGLYGFVSSHATNFFGVATLVFLVLNKKLTKPPYWIFIWAGLISYTRIYLGVHYPADIVCGGILGFAIGWGVYRILNHYILKKA